MAAKIAVVRDAVARVQSVLPTSVDTFRGDRTAREIVTLNLFVAIQECVALASHVIADAGWSVPKSYGETFELLARHGIMDPNLAVQLRAAAGLRNLLAHQYGVVDFDRLFEFARANTTDLTTFCAVIARLAAKG
ncbi:MAG: DUF86 domain-containing protein [Gammaproteobacteria bacterium]